MLRVPRVWTIGLVTVCVAACSSGQQPVRGPRPLSPDSAALLRKALTRVQPAYATQAEAVRSGVYEEGRLAHGIRPRVAPPARPLGQASAFLIQLSAYRDPAVAEQSAREAEQRFPGRPVVIESAGGVYRVALSGWSSLAAAEAELGFVRRLYADAWVRPRGTP